MATGPRIVLIAAVMRDGGIGRDGELLVRIGEDLQRLKRLTTGFPVVMGRKTWQSIGKPLPGRRNLVVSRDPTFAAPGAEVVPSLAAALATAGHVEQVAVLGGASLYAEALPIADRLILTEIDAVHPADTFFPVWQAADFVEVSREARQGDGGPNYAFVEYRRKPNP